MSDHAKEVEEISDNGEAVRDIKEGRTYVLMRAHGEIATNKHSRNKRYNQLHRRDMREIKDCNRSRSSAQTVRRRDASDAHI